LDTGLVPVAQAAASLATTAWTLKRWHREGHLPAVIMQGRWYIPASFLDAVLSSPRPAQAGVLEEIADTWFTQQEAAPVSEHTEGR
jgi:hypothetical protein